MTTRAGYAFGRGWAQRSLGRLATADGDTEAARDRLEEALATFSGISARFEAARTRLDLAALPSLGDQGLIHATEARRAFAELRVPRYVSRAGAVLSEVRTT